MALQQIINQVDALKLELDALRPIKPEQEQRIMQKLRLEWTYHSNAIEGNTLTFGETKAFLLHGITAQGKPFREYLDIEGHAEAIEYLQDFIRREEILTEAAIRELHKIILVRPYEVDAMTQDGRSTKRTIQPGQYKSMPNHVRTSSGDIHYYASPEDTPIFMSELVTWYRDALAKGELHKLILAATFHYRFVAIHPFDDGNGRMARLLMNLILMQAGYVPTIVQTGTKNEYLLALEKADEDNDLSDFITLVGTELNRSLKLYLRGARGESIDEPTDLDKQLSILLKKIEAQKSERGPEKGRETLSSLYNNTLKPFLILQFLQIRKFDALFASNRFQMSYGVENTKNRNLADDFERSLQQLDTIFRETPQLNGIGITYSWNGFSLNNRFNLQIQLTITFSQFFFAINYRLAGEGKNLLQNERYDTVLSEEELYKLTKNITDDVLAIIKEKTNSE